LKRDTASAVDGSGGGIDISDAASCCKELAISVRSVTAVDDSFGALAIADGCLSFHSGKSL